MSDHYDRYNGMDKLGTNLAEVGTDLISRQAAIDYCEALMNAERVQQTDDWGYGRERYNQTECIMQYIENMPYAKPKRIRGKWIEYEQEFMLEGSLETVQKTVKECSVCTAKIAGMVGIMNFCPNCGAKMGVTE